MRFWDLVQFEDSVEIRVFWDFVRMKVVFLMMNQDVGAASGFQNILPFKEEWPRGDDQPAAFLQPLVF